MNLNINQVTPNYTPVKILLKPRSIENQRAQEPKIKNFIYLIFSKIGDFFKSIKTNTNKLFQQITGFGQHKSVLEKYLVELLTNKTLENRIDSLEKRIKP